MRLVSFAAGGRVSWGVLEESRVIELGGDPELDGIRSLEEALRAHDLMAIAMCAVGRPPTLTAADLELLDWGIAPPAQEGCVAAAEPAPTALVIGTHTRSWLPERDPLEYVAGDLCEFVGGPRSGRPVLRTRDEWVYDSPTLDLFRRALRHAFRSDGLAPADVVWVDAPRARPENS
ncbi:hypothetical protein CFH99_24530 [Nocardioides aromaticivorans]|uniref:Rv2993c-like N-terminal domain-containing protein n=1 Tax=Nocardioides aromaticivorans TaxID=200618 RepID=A0ABX7PT33_9ACTN|nr:DUF2437 domain-containing protein [Nocardioides aromaticivorans]QSR28793.1 hypothetical protein CFH99_24530 [Nocardioides aromaticivorans]